MARIVEAQHRLLMCGAECGECGCLVAGHVAAEAGQEDHGGAVAVVFCPGQLHAVAAIEPSGGLHGRYIRKNNQSSARVRLSR